MLPKSDSHDSQLSEGFSRKLLLSSEPCFGSPAFSQSLIRKISFDLHLELPSLPPPPTILAHTFIIYDNIMTTRLYTRCCLFRLGFGVSAGVLQQVLQMRAQQLFGIGHGFASVAGVYRISGTGAECRVGRGGKMGRHQSSGRIQARSHVRQPVRAQEPAGVVQRDRRAYGRSVGGRAAPQGHVHVRHGTGKAEMVHRGVGQSRKTSRSQPLNRPATKQEYPICILYLICI